MTPNPRRLAPVLIAATLACGLLCATASAHAYDQVVIRDGRNPVTYDLELEPHLVLGTAPPGPGHGSGAGLGVRGSLVILPEGFIPRLNDSIAIGLGLDFGRYDSGWGWDGYRDQCVRFEPGPNGTSVCTETTGYGGSHNYVFIPIVMQWNFWFTRRFSAFGEPGIDLYYLGHHGFDFVPAVYVGGRVYLRNNITLTGRIGYPTVALGVSFLL